MTDSINQISISQIISQFTNDKQSIVEIDKKKLDSYKDINQHLIEINKEMLQSGKEYYFGTVMTLDDVKKSSLFFNLRSTIIIYSIYLFIFKRLLPKVAPFKNWSLFKSLRVYSQAEVMGRLQYNGFRVIKFLPLNDHLHYYLAKIETVPMRQEVEEGLLIKLTRIGKCGKPIKIYKFRTMHPYSEFIHDYMIKHHGFDKKGKIENDFRIAGWGRFLRKTWLDELPQIINLIKGELKIFGVRPVSQTYFNTLSTEYQTIRNNQKPGCIPPYLVFSDGQSKENCIESEKIYLKESIEKNLFLFDIKCTFIAISNIIFKGKRSS
jgi:lipopolysaccharide/colanic/teichoic acid biosynthesis glycosyltransferase